MHENTLYQKTKATIALIKNIPILQNFYLAGGTSLALQLGHRKSIDLDFFARQFPKKDDLFNAFKHLSYKTTQEAPDTLDLKINDTKVSFLQYDYDLIGKFTPYQNLRLASIQDIACMKLSTIISRGEKKDFIDLYFLLQKFSLKQLLSLMQKKFAHINYSQILLIRSLNYFADADQSPMPEMLINVSWDKIKTEIQTQVMAYLHAKIDN
jgi:predicted nucleotidyltransferase component of viral defense system